MSGWGWLLGSNHSLWGKTEVLCQVDNLHVLRNIVLLQERFALAMTEAEEDNIYLVERHLGGKLQVGLAIQSLVNFSHQVACITLAVGEVAGETINRARGTLIYECKLSTLDALAKVLDVNIKDLFDED